MAQADPRQYDESGNVIGNYLSPEEAREQGLEWHGRPNEPAPYLTEDESRGLWVPYKPQSAFPQYQYSGRTPSGPTPPRTRQKNPMEDLMATIQRMNQTPGGWQSGDFRGAQSPRMPMPPPSAIAQAQSGSPGSWVPLDDGGGLGPSGFGGPGPTDFGGFAGPVEPLPSMPDLNGPLRGFEPPRPPGIPPEWVVIGTGWDGQPMWGPPELKGSIFT